MASTSTISSLGVGSGIDAETIVTKLVALESQPITQLKTEASKVQSKISAYGKIQSAVSDLQSAARKITSLDTWGATTASSSDSTAVTASTSSGAQTGSYSVVVNSLAKPQSVVSNSYMSSSSAALGASGTLTIELGSWSDSTFTAGSSSVSVSVAATDTLETIRDKINKSSAGIKATIITDSSGSRLVMQSSDTGASNGFRITAADADGNNTDDSGLSTFAYAPDQSTSGTTLTQSSSDASATINGVAVTSTSNTLSEVITGLTITLSKASSTATTITVGQDNDSITAAIQDFATKYTALTDLLRTNTKYDEGTKTAGTLQGDSGAVSILNQMRAIIGGSSSASSTYTTLSSIGLEVQSGGGLTVNASKLKSALGNLQEVKKLLGNSDSSDSTKDGIGTRIRALTDSLLDLEGTLTTRTKGLNTTLDYNEKRQEQMQNRVDLYEKRLRAQYTALDTAMAKLTSNSNYVTQMINSLNNTSSSSNS
ncbi:flagellar filament capping protein FliD [Aquabacterium sp.]|uniref:flagellar filament capping protein FliD n=1 Tax=Aquabacterium sp. TaxID=1872578 RepID=UPI0035B4FA8A